MAEWIGDWRVGDQVLVTARNVEQPGEVTVVWPDGAVYVRLADGDVIACGEDVLARVGPKEGER